MVIVHTQKRRINMTWVGNNPHLLLQRCFFFVIDGKERLQHFEMKLAPIFFLMEYILNIKHRKQKKLWIAWFYLNWIYNLKWSYSEDGNITLKIFIFEDTKLTWHIFTIHEGSAWDMPNVTMQKTVVIKHDVYKHVSLRYRI